jgi:hypothetical protein
VTLASVEAAASAETAEVEKRMRVWLDLTWLGYK